MAFHVRDPETDTLIGALARKRGCGLTEAVKQAVPAELCQDGAATPVRERLGALQEVVAAIPDTGLDADKAFYDELWGNPD